MIEFGIRVSRDKVAITSVPKDYAKAHPGFMKRLPKALATRDRELVEEFLGEEIEPGRYTMRVEKARNGNFIVGSCSRGYRKTEVVKNITKVLINRNNGIGIRLCFIPDELVGQRVSIS